MADVQEIVAAYAAAWNELDTAARRRALDRAWAEGGIYSDPTARVEGRDALVAHIAGFQAQMPGARILLTSSIDAHHGALRFTWAVPTRNPSAIMPPAVRSDDGVRRPPGWR